MTKKRVTVDFDEESYYLDGEYWESWDNYGEEMADKINELLNEFHEENQRLKQYTKQVLQNHLDGWRKVYNPIDENLVVEINIVKSIAEDLGVDLE